MAKVFFRSRLWVVIHNIIIKMAWVDLASRDAPQKTANGGTNRRSSFHELYYLRLFNCIDANKKKYSTVSPEAGNPNPARAGFQRVVLFETYGYRLWEMPEAIPSGDTING